MTVTIKLNKKKVKCQIFLELFYTLFELCSFGFAELTIAGADF
jgi:hypothetical protein